MGKLFGTDGVRGVANTELTPELAFKLGKAGAYALSVETKHSPRIIVGRDTRISGYMLEAAISAGGCSVGADVYLAGVIPTPAIAYLVRKYGLDAGVMITASHNQYEDNGIKFFNTEGYKLSDVIESEIEDIIFNRMDELPVLKGEGVGRGFACDDALTDYLDFLKVAMDDIRLDGFNVAMDCANGATSAAAPLVLFDLGASVSVINNDPDGVNINQNCGSMHMEELVAHVVSTGADIGLAFDGDGDRCLLVDENGVVVQGDEIMSICANFMKEVGGLAEDTLVATVMSNLGLFIMGEEMGIKVEKTSVGDRYVLERMLEGGFSLGGEQSGHIIFLEHNPTGDGILTALQVLKIMKLTGKTLSQLNTHMKVLPQVLVNAVVSNEKKYGYESDDEIMREIEELEAIFAGKGRVLIRPSGTEPLIRVMIEGDDRELLSREAKRVAELIERKLGD